MVEYKGNIKPEVTDVVTKMSAASIKDKLKKIIQMIIGGAVIGGIAIVIAVIFELNWLKITGYIIGGLIIAFGIYSSLKAQVAACPYCNGIVGAGDDDLQRSDEYNKVECPHCYEWLTSHKGELRAFSLSDLEKRDEFDEKIKFSTPVFKGGVWPNECIVCGGTATKHEEAKKTSVNVAKLLVGRLSVTNAGIKNIPYCDEHSDAVKITVENETPRLIFNDYDMLRRYITLNKHLKVLKK